MYNVIFLLLDYTSFLMKKQYTARAQLVLELELVAVMMAG
jgi:hypothetical protein